MELFRHTIERVRKEQEANALKDWMLYLDGESVEKRLDKVDFENKAKHDAHNRQSYFQLGS